MLARPFANHIHKKITKDSNNALATQEAIFQQIIKQAAHTVFGKEHHFTEIKNHADFVQSVPVRDYEQIKQYIQMIKDGKQNVLWRGKPIYFAKTSGTTSGIKYIPITKDSIDNHIQTARNALLCYLAETGNNQFVNGKMIFLSGSPELERIADIPTGRLSGIVNHHVPKYLRGNQLPSYETNCIEDWETKLDKIVDETLRQNMTLISGIPPWMQMYFDRIVQRSGKKVKDVFPNFSLMVQGGVNFEPYKAKLFETVGKKIDYVELYPASEGFFAFQDTQNREGMLLNTNSGIYFEFIPVEDVFNPAPRRLNLSQVELGKNYAIIINSNAGLWAYNIGDTVRFVSLHPYRIVVSGRIKHFISAFGEHVIGEEVEWALQQACKHTNVRVTEFTVAPYITQGEGKSYHEWLVEFENEPQDLAAFVEVLDNALRQKNVYYDDLIRGNILQVLKIRLLRKDAFIDYMKSIGKLGGQNKVPRLSNDRNLADALQVYIV